MRELDKPLAGQARIPWEIRRHCAGIAEVPRRAPRSAPAMAATVSVSSPIPIAVAGVTDELNTATAGAKLVTGMKAPLAEVETDSMSERQLAAKRHRPRPGSIMSSRPAGVDGRSAGR